jgi:cytidine deaminase
MPVVVSTDGGRARRFISSVDVNQPTAADQGELTMAWQAMLAGASAALAHHAIVWFTRNSLRSRSTSTSSDTEILESYTPRQMQRFYQDSILPAWSQLSTYCFNAYGRTKEDLHSRSLSSVFASSVLWSPLIAALALTSSSSRHPQKAWWWMGTSAAASWMMFSHSMISIVPSSKNNEQDDKTNPIEKKSEPRRAPVLPPPSLRSDSSSSRPERYLELLVHNVSHTDLILSCAVDKDDDDDDDDEDDVKNKQDGDDPYSLCRPRFSCFDLYSRKVLKEITNVARQEELRLIRSPRYQRSLDSPRLSIQPAPTNHPMTPIGFQLPTPVPIQSWHDLRLRGRDQAKVFHATSPENQRKGSIGHVFFPLLATLLPRWHQQIAQKAYPAGKPVQRILLLVTGVGTPRNWTHSMTGNSTITVADLMRVFLRRVDPFLTVLHVHSTTNLFRYDENLLFCERELVPAMDAYRDAHARGLPYPTTTTTTTTTTPGATTTTTNTTTNLSAPHHQDAEHPFNLDWQKSFSVTLSFADGSPARTHAIQAGLRPYRPTYFHFWQLKTFWHESKIVDDDIEVHTFETMNTVPPMDAAQCTDPWINATVQEMKAFFTETMQTADQRDPFWLRKTQKPVLAVLLVQTPEMKEPVLYRGTNMEVSMPTGSLCAERCVIGSALAQNPALKREDLKLIAVLSVPQVEQSSSSSSSSPPPQEGTGSGGTMRKVRSTSTITSLDDRRASIGSEQEINPGSRRSSIGEDEGDWFIPNEGEASSDTAPLRRIPLFSSSQVVKRSSKQPPQSQRTVVIHSYKDLNPLAPCGTCNEWLKKISEANPYFRIITFTDANCNGIYVARCQE